MAVLAAASVMTIRWSRLLIAAVVALALVASSLRDAGFDRTSAIEGLRLAAVALGVAMTFVVGDPMAQLVRSTPVPLLIRRAVRIAVAASVPACTWVMAVSLVLADALRSSAPTGGLVLRPTGELVVVVLVGLALAAGIDRHTDRGEAAAALLLLAGVGLLSRAPVGQLLWPSAGAGSASVASIAVQATVLFGAAWLFVRWSSDRA